MDEKEVAVVSSLTFSNEIPPPSDCQNFYITFTDWKGSSATASTSEDYDDASSNRYQFIFHVKKPHMIVESSIPTEKTNPVAHVNFHTFSVKFDVEMYPTSTGSDKQEFVIKSKSMMASKPEYVYSSPGLGGGNMTWQTQGALKGYFNFALLDANAQALARFTAAGFKGNWSSKKIGKMEVMPVIANKVEVVDEAITTLMAIVYHHFMQVNPTGALVMAASSSS